MSRQASKTEGPRAELLAPAGSWESMEAAVRAGADAVYMGGSRFGARAYAENPEDDRLLQALDYVHFHDRKLYLTVNTLLKERELSEELYDYLEPLYRRGLDAVIVQDYGVLAFVRRNFPKLDVHISTQMTVAGPYGARLVEELGATRLVLPRELSLEEIRELRQSTSMEIEAFVHGALCYCYSGQCLLSSLIGGRSGNRGRCAQPCRLPYNGRTLLNLKDLCTLSILPQILEAGVFSLKIEGRMKSPRYTAGVVHLYRKYLDRCLRGETRPWRVEEQDLAHLSDLFDRGGFTDGYYRRHNGADMIFQGQRPAHREVDEAWLRSLDSRFLEKEIQEKIKGNVRIIPDTPVTIEVSKGGHTVCVQGELVGRAEKQPLTLAGVQKQLGKTGGSGYEWESLDIVLAEDSFLPVSALNRLRREAFAALTKERLHDYQRTD